MSETMTYNKAVRTIRNSERTLEEIEAAHALFCDLADRFEAKGDRVNNRMMEEYIYDLNILRMEGKYAR